MAPPMDDRWCGVPVGDCTGRFLALLEAAGGDTNDTGGRAPIDDDDPSPPGTRWGVLTTRHREWPLHPSHPHVTAATHYCIDPQLPEFRERKLTLELSVHREAAPAHEYERSLT